MPQQAYTEFANQFVEQHLCPTCGREMITPAKFGLVVTAQGIQYRDQFVAISVFNLRIIDLLFRAYPGIVTKERIYQAVWGHDPDPPIPKTIDVHIWKIRRLLKPLGLELQTWWGRGWSLLIPDGMLAIEKVMHTMSDNERNAVLQNREVLT